MHKAQIAQSLFVALTLVQVVVFVFRPEWYDSVSAGMEGFPYHAAFRLIGCKEIGLMSLYTAGIVLNDMRLTYITAIGRLSVLMFTPLMIYGFGASTELWGGVVQDLGGSLGALYFLRRSDTESQHRRQMLPVLHNQALCRLMVLVSGAMEFAYGLNLLLNPMQPEIFLLGVYGQGFGMRAFGFMTLLLGLYQVTIACLSGEWDGLVYLAVAFHHLWFFLAAKFGLNHTLPGIEFHPPRFHWQLGSAILLSVVYASFHSKQD